nr:LysR substrate-binding domain-containing protein [Janthinobacterium lividum]
MDHLRGAVLPGRTRCSRNPGGFAGTPGRPLLFQHGAARQRSAFHRKRHPRRRAPPRHGRRQRDGLYIELGLAGHGLMQLAEILVSGQLQAGQLVEVLADRRPAPVPVSLLYPHQRFLSPAMRAFSEWTAELFGNGA